MTLNTPCHVDQSWESDIRACSYFADSASRIKLESVPTPNPSLHSWAQKRRSSEQEESARALPESWPRPVKCRLKQRPSCSRKREERCLCRAVAQQQRTTHGPHGLQNHASEVEALFQQSFHRYQCDAGAQAFRNRFNPESSDCSLSSKPSSACHQASVAPQDDLPAWATENLHTSASGHPD